MKLFYKQLISLSIQSQNLQNIYHDIMLFFFLILNQSFMYNNFKHDYLFETF